MAGDRSALPIEAVIPGLLNLLREEKKAVVIAPPGAGKTTMIAPALLHEPWCAEQIILLSPRRLAARAAAERISELLGEGVGGTAGYATRLDTNYSARTRILVVTEGLFRNRILVDPELAGVSAILFDEVHERSLDSDFALALALEVQEAFRPDLRLVAMSATLDGERFSQLMGNAPVVESEGRSFPVEFTYLSRAAERAIDDVMASAIRQALRHEEGDILAFLPGIREIDRTAERLGEIGGSIVHKLHGQIDPAAQRLAIRRDGQGRRKIILATSIAETSLTIDGVRIVIDSGLARRPRFDRSAGIARLVTERVSLAAATQRAGRAGRQGPGVAYRLWEEAATSGLVRYDSPEILESDLTALVLDCALWGAEPQTLRWLEPPPISALTQARKNLLALEALDEAGRVTPHGRAMAKLPLPPFLAHMLLRGAAAGQADLAGEVAVLLSERGLGGPDADLEIRLSRWRAEAGRKAEAARGLARRWAKLAVTMVESPEAVPLSLAGLVAIAYPDRLSKRRAADGSTWISAGGRGFRLDPLSPLARNEWLAVADVQGIASGARILSAAALTSDELVSAEFERRIQTSSVVSYDSVSGRVSAERQTRLGAILLKSGPDAAPDRDAIAQALVDAVRRDGIKLLPWSDNAENLRQRAAYAGETSLNDAMLIETVDQWLAPLVAGLRKLGDIDSSRLTEALNNRLEWDVARRIDRIAPPHFITPAGTSHRIDYVAEGGPVVEARVQAFFGLDKHPLIGDPPVPLVLSLTSPAGRPIQTTRDLPGFWAGSWRDVVKEMRGRYPKHPWPDDPASAAATIRTKKADARRRSD